MNLVRIQTLWADINFKGIGLPATKSADLCIRETFVGRMRCGSNAKTVTFIPAGVKATERRHSIKPGLDPGLDPGPWTLDPGLWTLDSGLPIKI